MAANMDYRKLLMNEVYDLSAEEAEKVYHTVICLREQILEERLEENENFGFATDSLVEAEMAALGARRHMLPA